MKKRLFLMLLSLCLAIALSVALVSCDEGGGNTPGGNTPGGNTPQKLNAPVVTLTDNVASWEANANADKFEISLDGSLSYVENSVTSKTLSSGQTMKIRAVGDGVNYSTSDWSNSVTFIQNAPATSKLYTPDVTVSSSGMASWSAIPNAVGYTYKIDGGAETFTSNTSVQLTNGQSITVKAVGDGTAYTDSDYSLAKTYEESTGTQSVKLDTPAVTVSANGMAGWSAIPNAVGYTYKINGGAETFTSNTSVQLTNGQSITVKALGDGTAYTDSDYSLAKTYEESTGIQPVKLDTPAVTVSSNGMASWSAIPNAVGYTYKINGGAETFTSNTSVQLTNGQSITVKAVGDGTSYTDSDYSTSKTYTQQSSTPTGDEPRYMGILVSRDEPKSSNGVPDVFLPFNNGGADLMSLREYRDFRTLINEYFENTDNYIGAQYPSESDYDMYSTQGSVVYIQIWLDNPEQYTILSLKLNGVKYQVGGNLFSFFINDGTRNYNCLYAAVTIPSGSYGSIDYEVTDIEYIANTFINADGTDEFMNENDTVSIGLPYSDERVRVSTLEPTEIGTSEYKTSFDVTDLGTVVERSGSWLGIAVYDEERILFNKGLTLGNNTVEVSGLAENTLYTVEVYIYGDLHDGEGVRAHTVALNQVTTESDVDYFIAEAGYYSKWGDPELGEEPDSGLSVNVSLYLKSSTATYDRLELYKGEELVYTNNEFAYSEAIENLLANTQYTVRIYYSDENYSEHYAEQTVVTGRMEAPKVELQGEYPFLSSALFTFNSIENGFLRQAIAKNVRVVIYASGIWQLEYMDYILMLCDDPGLYDRVQAEYDKAVENNNWGLASKIDHEILTFLREAKNIINDGELGNFGTDRAAWENYFATVSRTFYLGEEDFFDAAEGAGLSHLIFRDYFTMFSDGDANYKVFADVDMKDGEGFVKKELDGGSIYGVYPINSENNRLEFDCEIDGMHITVNPYFKIDGEQQKILVVSYEIGLYTTSGEFVDTLYTSKEISWNDFDEEAWINAYVCAMKGEAILPSEDEIIKAFGWRAIFEMLNNFDFGFEDDFIGGGSSGDVIVGGNGMIVQGGRGEKNIANERERQILRELLAYDYPEWYEYDLKTSMLEAFMCDEYYYDIIDGINGIDEQLEALISEALNSSIQRVIGECESGIYHFLSWFGSENDEIYIGFKKVIEDYMEDTGKESSVNWQESYRRIMMFEDFYYFYPFGYIEDFEIELEEGKYSAGKYYIGIKYRYDSYEQDRYEVEYCYTTVKITGKLPVPTFEIQNGGYIAELRADVKNFWGYHFEIEVTNAQGEVVYTGRMEDWQAGGEAPTVSKNWSVRARTVFNEGESSDIYSDSSAWSEPIVYEGLRLDKVELDYWYEQGGVGWYSYDEAVSHYSYTINDGVVRTLTRREENFIYLEYGDVLKIKAVPTENAIAYGYLESYYTEYTCEDERQSLDAPSNLYLDEDKSWLVWDTVIGAEYYIVEITRGTAIERVERYENYYDYLEIGKTYRVKAVSNNSEKKASDYSEPYTYSVKLENTELYRATSSMIVWYEVPLAEGYYCKVGENGQVETLKIPRFEMTKLAVGESLYVQAYAEGCESSDWVLIYTRTSEEIGK